MEVSSLRKRLARFVDLQSQQASPSVRASVADVNASPARARSPGTPAAARRARDLSPAPTPDGGNATLPLSPVPTPAPGPGAAKRGGLFLLESESQPEDDTNAALMALMGTSAAMGALAGDDTSASAAWARGAAASGVQSPLTPPETGAAGVTRRRSQA